jgi:hypothetical protein
VVEVQSTLALPKALQINGSIHQRKKLVSLFYITGLRISLFKQDSKTSIFGAALFEK